VTVADEGTTTEAPEQEPPPPPQIEERSLWDNLANPGGDPGQLRVAADAWDRMAGRLDQAADDIDNDRNRLGADWTGEARESYQAHSVEVVGSLREAAGQFRSTAGELRRVADEMQRINDEMHDLYIAITATAAVSIGLAFVTFGASAAAGAAATAANLARAGQLVRAMTTLVSAARVSFTGFRAARFIAFWRTFAIGGAVNGALVQGFQGQNPLDPDSWTIAELRSVVLSSTGGAIFAGPALNAGLSLRTTVGLAGTGNAAASVFDSRLSGLGAGDTALNALIAFGAGGAGAAAGHGLSSGLRNVFGGGPRVPNGGVYVDDLADLGVTVRPAPVPPGAATSVDDLLPARPGSAGGAGTPSGTATSIDDLVLPGRPAPAGPAPSGSGGSQPALIDPTAPPAPGNPDDLLIPGRPPASTGTPPQLVLPGDDVVPPRPPLPPQAGEHVTDGGVHLPNEVEVRPGHQPGTAAGATIEDALGGPTAGISDSVGEAVNTGGGVGAGNAVQDHLVGGDDPPPQAPGQLPGTGPDAITASDAAYTSVGSGETLADVAQRVYGDPARAADLLEINPNLGSPQDVVEGQVLRVLPYGDRVPAGR
jgi:WXG100 family type VII secretion target